MTYSVSHVAAAEPTGARSVRRYVFWTLSILLLALVVLVGLVRMAILPPTEVLSYQLGFSPRPLLGDSIVDFRTWGWYPIKAEVNSAGSTRQVTFVKFSPLNEPEKHPISIFHREELFPDEYFSMEMNFPYGSAKFFKPGILTNKEIHFAWVRDHQLFIAAKDDAELLQALSALEIKKRK